MKHLKISNIDIGDDDVLRYVYFVADSDCYFVVERARQFLPQAVASGLDTYYFEYDSQDLSGYGGIASVEERGGGLTFTFTPQMAAELEFEQLALDVSQVAETWEHAREVLQWVLQDCPSVRLKQV